MAVCLEQLRSDREIVLAAVQHDGHALRHASEELLASRKFVPTAAQLTGLALQHAS